MRKFPIDIRAGDGLFPVKQELDSTELEKVSMSLLEENGYILIRNLLPLEDVTSARDAIHALMKSEGFVENDWVGVKPQNEWKSPELLKRQEWIQSQEPIMRLLEHENIYTVMKKLLIDSNAKSEKVIYSLPHKWLRAVQHGEFTGFHKDSVYVGHISDHLVTCWIPITNVELERGSMIVAPQSNRPSRWKAVKELYSNLKIGADGDGTTDGWLARDLNELKHLFEPDDFVATTDFSPGDVVILLLETLHMTAMNVTDLYRISCDTRWIAL